MQGIKHYLINTKSVFDDYNVCAYQKDARKILKELIKERAQIDAQNDILTEGSQNNQYNILSLNLSDTIDFLNNCTSEELYWVSELFERLREISGLTCDCEALINKMFKKDEPILLFNDWKNESDKNEFDGIKYLFLTLHKMIRKYY